MSDKEVENRIKQIIEKATLLTNTPTNMAIVSRQVIVETAKDIRQLAVQIQTIISGCPDTQATCFQCENYIPKDNDEGVPDDVAGTCNEGAYTEIGNPHVLLCEHEDGWCTGYKKKEVIFETRLPSFGEVIESPIYKEQVPDRLNKEYPATYYHSRFDWHKTEFKERFLNVYITDRNTGKQVDHWKLAFVKQNGVIVSV